MREIIIDIAIKVGVMIAGAVITLLLSKVEKIKDDKLRKVATAIAQTVEQIYRGCTSEEKLAAFKELCVTKKINVNKAVEFLESVIIPSSKNINVLPHEEAKKQSDLTDEEKRGLE